MLTPDECVKQGINPYGGYWGGEILCHQSVSTKNKKYFSTNEVDILGDRMKALEAKYDQRVPDDHIVVVRLDGKGFSNFTRPLKEKEPFHPCFTQAMVQTCKKLMNMFGGEISTAYTHSDEITLILPPVPKADDPKRQATRAYNGRVSKLLTLFSATASVAFNDALREALKVAKEDSLSQLYENYIGVFDARILSFEDTNLLTDHQKWRSTFDCYRNCVSSYVRCYFSAKMCHKKKTPELIQMMLTKGFDFVNQVPNYLKHGIHVKRYQRDERTDLSARSFIIREDVSDLLLAKYWPEDSRSFAHEIGL